MLGVGFGQAVLHDEYTGTDSAQQAQHQFTYTSIMEVGSDQQMSRKLSNT